MLIPQEKIDEAKRIYDGKAMEEIVEYLGVAKWDEKNKKGLCPFHKDVNPSFIWNDKNNSFHCFAKETNIITDKGIIPIKDLVNKKSTVINGNGEWEDVIFRNCGKQELMKITLTSNGKYKEIYATPEHEWVVRNRKKKIETKNLKPNHKLERMWLKKNNNLIPDKEGMRHGFLYGDGYNNEGYCIARICDEKKYKFCKQIFDDVNEPSDSILKSLPNCFGVIKYKSDYNAKKIPISEDLNYLYGFLVGYFVADGNCTDETIQIHSAKYDDLKQIKHIFTILGIPSYPIGSTIRKKGKDMSVFVLRKDSPLYVLRIVKSEIPDNFYQSDKKPKYKSIYKSYLGWKVVKIEKTDRYEDVYCCETSTHSFVLEDFILTGNCFGCNRNYGIIDLYLDQGMTYIEAVRKLFEETNIEYNFSMKGVHSKPAYKYPIRENGCNERKTVNKYWKKRKISSKTLDYLDVQEDDKGNTVFHFYDENDVLLSVKYRPSHKINEGESKCWFQKDANNTPILFNMNRIDPSKPLIITEGEPDCMSIIEAGYTNVVSVPSGCKNMKWIEQCWDWLEQFQKIIVWEDNDEPGIKARNEICNRLGTWRTYYVEPKDKINGTTTIKEGLLPKDANEVLYFFGKEKVLEYINEPIELPVEGVIDLADAEEFDIENAEGLYTGINELDKQIYKIVFGTVNIITGKSGEGKSVFVNQLAICQALEQNYDVFVFSGELPAPVLKNWIEVNMIGRENMDLIQDGHVRQFHAEPRKAMRDWYSGRVMVYDDSVDTTASTLLKKMEEMARKFGTRVFLIDNLMMVDLECDEESRLQAEKNFIKDLINFAKKFNVLVFLVAHPRKVGDVRVTKEDIAGSSNIVNLAHMVFSVHRYSDSEKDGELNNRGTYNKGKEPIEYDSVVEVLKNRITGLVPKVDLYFDYPSYRFYRTPEELWHRYKWNKNKEPLRTDDPNAELREKRRAEKERSPIDD